MAIPKFEKEHIIDALKYIDKNGVPDHNQSTKYELVTDDGKRYPPKYVLAVADHLANGQDISTDGFNTLEARSYLESQGFTIETKQQEKFKLSITAEGVMSTDNRFTMEISVWVIITSHWMPASKRHPVRWLSALIVKAKEEIPIRRYHVSLVRFLNGSLHPFLLRAGKTSRFVNTNQTVI